MVSACMGVSVEVCVGGCARACVCVCVCVCVYVGGRVWMRAGVDAGGNGVCAWVVLHIHTKPTHSPTNDANTLRSKAELPMHAVGRLELMCLYGCLFACVHIVFVCACA